MNDGDMIRELNRMPVNVKARGLLEMDGEEVREESLHCVHAALYAIKRGEVIVEMDVSETVTAMMTWRPPPTSGNSPRRSSTTSKPRW